MRLIVPKYGLKLELKENQIITLVLEHPRVFTELLQNLIAQTEGADGEWILSDGDKCLSIAKTMVLISNPLLADCNEKRVLNRLYKELAEHVQDGLLEAYCAVNTHIIGFLDDVINMVPYHLEMNVETDAGALFKTYGIQLATTDMDPFERLVDYLRAYRSICGIQIFVVLNLKQYFTKEQVQQLYEFCFYEKIYLINVEGQKNYSADEEICVIIDKDLCVIAPE